MTLPSAEEILIKPRQSESGSNLVARHNRCVVNNASVKLAPSWRAVSTTVVRSSGGYDLPSPRAARKSESDSIVSWVSGTGFCAALCCGRLVVRTGEAARALRRGDVGTVSWLPVNGGSARVLRRWLDRSSLTFKLCNRSHSSWARLHWSCQYATRSRYGLAGGSALQPVPRRS